MTMTRDLSVNLTDEDKMKMFLFVDQRRINFLTLHSVHLFSQRHPGLTGLFVLCGPLDTAISSGQLSDIRGTHGHTRALPCGHPNLRHAVATCSSSSHRHLWTMTSDQRCQPTFAEAFLVRDLGWRIEWLRASGHRNAQLVECLPFRCPLVDNCFFLDDTRLVQSRVSGEARCVRFAQPLLMRFLRRLSATGHAGDGADHRPQRFLGRVSMLFRAARRVRAVRPRETAYSHSRRLCPLLENVDVH